MTCKVLLTKSSNHELVCFDRHVMREAEERFEFHDRDKDGFILEDEFKETMLGKNYSKLHVTIDVI